MPDSDTLDAATPHKRAWRARGILGGRLVPTLPQLWALTTVTAVFILLGLGKVGPHDFWWHVRAGQWIVENGRVPGVDLFSFTQAGQPFPYQMWLMEVAFYALLRAGDLPLVMFFHTVVITAAYGLVLLVSRQASDGNLRWASLATFAAAAVGITNWNVRPQTVSFLLLAATLLILERYAGQSEDAESPTQGGRVLWFLPPLFVVWANAHGGFVFGLALVGSVLFAQIVTWLRRKGRFPAHLTGVTALSMAGTLLTPLGAGMVDYVLGFVRHPVTRSLNLEFMPPTVQTLSGQLFFGFVFLLVIVLVAGRYRPAMPEWLRLLVFGALALMAVRNVAWFGIVAAPTLAAGLNHWASQRAVARNRRSARRAINLAVAVALGLLAVASLPWFRPYLPLPSTHRAYVSGDTPVEAVNFLRDLPEPRRAFHSESHGSYMIWAIPETPVFIDTRVELYPPEQWHDYIALSYARYDWAEILDDYGIDTLLLEGEMMKWLVDAAQAAPEWTLVYDDDSVTILVRGDGT